MKSRDSAVKRALLDQSLVSGIGNIYADEALWRAQVHGERLCSALTKPALRRVLDHARDVMLAALGEGGTSFDALYVNVNGAVGLLRPVAARLRAGGSAVRPLRDADPARGLHEPLVVLVPALPAAAPAPPRLTLAAAG